MNTGTTIRDIEIISNKELLSKALKQILRNKTIIKRRRELFKRIKVSTIANLLKVSNKN